MPAKPETTEFGPLDGSLMRLAGGREIAIFLRDGTVSVADFKNGAASLATAGEWFQVNGRRIAHAQRRGEVDVISPIPGNVAARIERLYRPVVERARHPASRWSTRLAAFSGRFLGAFSNTY